MRLRQAKPLVCPGPALCPRKNCTPRRGRTIHSESLAIASNEKPTTAEEGGGFLESAGVIWAPHSCLTSAPPQAISGFCPQAGTRLSVGSVTLARGGRVAGETPNDGQQPQKRLRRSSGQSPSLLLPQKTRMEGEKGLGTSHLRRPQSHQVLSPVGPWKSSTSHCSVDCSFCSLGPEVEEAAQGKGC